MPYQLLLVFDDAETTLKTKLAIERSRNRAKERRLNYFWDNFLV